MTEKVEKRRAFLINLAYYGVIIAAFYLVLKTFAGILMPFILAGIIALLLHRPVRAITKKVKIGRSVPSIIGVFLLFGIIAGILFLVGWAIVWKVKDFFNYIMQEAGDLGSYAEVIRKWVTEFLDRIPGGFGDYATNYANDLFDKIIKDGLGSVATESNFDIMSLITTGTSKLKDTVGQIPSAIVGLVVTIIASIFLTIDYDRVTSFIFRQFKEERRKKIDAAVALTKQTFTKMIKAYSLIMLITFTEVSIGLFILRAVGIFDIYRTYILIIAALTSIVDIIPVLGTGTVLIPWAVVCVINGNYKMAIGLGIMYVVIFLIRQYLEPRMVAGQVGLPPIVTITAMYIGTKTLGVLGFFILPFIVIMIKEFNEKGILHWLKFTPSEEGNLPEVKPLPDFLKRKKKKSDGESEETDEILTEATETEQEIVNTDANNE